MFSVFEKIKNFFKSKHMKRIAESSDTSKLFWLIKKEKDIGKIQCMLSNYVTVLSSDEILEIISKMPVKNRLDMLSSYKRYITPYDLSEFIVKKLDTDWKIKALNEFKDILDIFDIYKIFENISPDKRIEALDVIVDRLDSSNLADMIKKYVPYSQRKEAILKYDNQLDVFSKVGIIKKMPSNDIAEVLEKYKDILSSSNILEILDKVPSGKIEKVINVVKDKLTSSSLADIITYKALEKDRLNLLLECSDYIEPAMIADIIKNALDNENRKIAILHLKDKLDEKLIGEIVQYYLKDDKELIEQLKNNMYEEDYNYLKKIG